MKKFIFTFVILVACASLAFGKMARYPHAVQGLVPVADAFSGTVTTDIVNFTNATEIHFYIFKGAGDTGTSRITVQACGDTSGTTADTVSIAYRVQKNTSGDTFGNDTAIAAAGFTTTAGANQIYKVVVRKNDIISANKKYLRIKAIEVVNHPVTGCILIVIPGLLWDRPVQPSSFLN